MPNAPSKVIKTQLRSPRRYDHRQTVYDHRHADRAGANDGRLHMVAHSSSTESPVWRRVVPPGWVLPTLWLAGRLSRVAPVHRGSRRCRSLQADRPSGAGVVRPFSRDAPYPAGVAPRPPRRHAHGLTYLDPLDPAGVGHRGHVLYRPHLRYPQPLPPQYQAFQPDIVNVIVDVRHTAVSRSLRRAGWRGTTGCPGAIWCGVLPWR
jgi:hypothetical protein